MNNVDRIFSEKLEGYTSAPPAGAWEKVEMVVSKRPATNQWLPIAIGRAAVLVPLVIAAGWMLTRAENGNTETLTASAPVSAVPAPVAVIHDAKTAPQPVAVRRKSVQPISPITPTLTPVAETIIAKPETSSPETIPIAIGTIEPAELVAEVIEPAPPQTVDKEPMVITITLESIAQAPDADKKPLEKVAEFAMAVKHSDPIGSLRTVKDELFALDLRKKSTKKN